MDAPVDKAGFDPNQARAPKGTAEGGRWVDGTTLELLPSRDKEWNELTEQSLKKPLTRAEKLALDQYTGDLHWEINNYLRFGEEAEWGVDIWDPLRNIETALAKSSLARPLIAYRGVSGRTWRKLVARGSFVDPGFTSVTLDPKVARVYARSGGGILEIRLPKGARALPINKDEAEILLDSGSRFKVLERKGKTLVVRLSGIRKAGYDPNQPRDRRGRWSETGAQGSAEGLKHHLGMIARLGEMNNQPNYVKTYQWLLEHGREFKFDDKSFCGGKAHECYRNAALAVWSNPNLTYVEGYISSHGVPIQHAWAVDRQGRVRDYTIKDPKGVKGYFGVPIQRDYLDKVLHRTKVYGLFDGKTFWEIVNDDPSKVVDPKFSKGFNPNQPRAPKGSEEGGQWIDTSYTPRAFRNLAKASMGDLAKDELTLVSSYTSVWNEFVNPWLRTGDVGVHDTRILMKLRNELDGILDRATLAEDVIAYRGVGRKVWATLRKLQEGSVLLDPAYVSTSVNKSIAQQFTSRKGPSQAGGLLKILLPKGSKALPILASVGAVNVNEFEVLVKRDSKFLVKKVGTKQITLELLSNTVKRSDTKTLYVRRDLLNGDELVEWAKEQGFKTTIPAEDFHVTITYSKTPLPWSNVGTPNKKGLRIARVKGRKLERLGEKGEAVVLRFESDRLAARHTAMKEAGASYDFDSYKPHVTISWDAPDLDLEKVDVYDGELVFGPEIYEEIDMDWKEKLTEKYSPNQPRHPKGRAVGGQWRSLDDGELDKPGQTTDEFIELYVDGLHSNLTKEEEKELRRYASATYSDYMLNDILRGRRDNSKQYQARIELLTKAIDKASLPKSLTAWRGTTQHGWELMNAHSVGTTFVDEGFASVSLRKKIGELYVNHGGRAPAGGLLEVRLPKGSKAIAVTNSGKVIPQMELVIQRGSRYRIVAKTPRKMTVELIESGIKKYSPNQPRAPKGSPEGGRWVNAYVEYDEQHEFLTRHEPDWDKMPKRFKNAAEDALEFYEMEGYIDINEELRQGKYNHAGKTIEELIDKYGVPLERDTIVFRGGIDAKRLKGVSSFTDPAFLSTSLEDDQAKPFIDKGDVLLEIKVPKGTKVLPGNLEEMELILQRNTKIQLNGFDGRTVLAEVVQ